MLYVIMDFFVGVGVIKCGCLNKCSNRKLLNKKVCLFGMICIKWNNIYNIMFIWWWMVF